EPQARDWVYVFSDTSRTGPWMLFTDSLHTARSLECMMQNRIARSYGRFSLASLFALVFGIASSASLVRADEPAKDPLRRITPSHDTDYVPSSEVVTPHVPLAKP